MAVPNPNVLPLRAKISIANTLIYGRAPSTLTKKGWEAIARVSVCLLSTMQCAHALIDEVAISPAGLTLSLTAQGNHIILVSDALQGEFQTNVQLELEIPSSATNQLLLQWRRAAISPPPQQPSEAFDVMFRPGPPLAANFKFQVEMTSVFQGDRCIQLDEDQDAALALAKIASPKVMLVRSAVGSGKTLTGAAIAKEDYYQLLLATTHAAVDNLALTLHKLGTSALR